MENGKEAILVSNLKRMRGSDVLIKQAMERLCGKSKRVYSSLWIWRSRVTEWMEKQCKMLQMYT